MILLWFKTKRHKHTLSRLSVQKNQHVFHSSEKETKPSRLPVNKSKTTVKKPIANLAHLAM